MKEILDLINEMSPFLLLGFLIAGVMHAFIPEHVYTRYLSGRSFRSVLNAAIFGVPLPLCSCGVIPTAMSLRREGASRGAVVSFMIATPQTGVDSIFATYSLMGLPFAVVRPIAAFVTALLGGTFVNAFDEEEEENPTASQQLRHDDSEPARQSFLQKVASALRFGFVEMMEDIGKWLVVGLLVAGLITVFVPNEFFAIFKDDTLMSMLLVLCISIPMYVCATGSIPIAVVLMMKGLTPGSALVLLMAGPACNAASMLVIGKVLGRKALVFYLVAIVVGAVAFGFGVDYLLPREWFTASLIGSHACCHEGGTSWWQWASTALLTVLLLNVLRMRLMHQPTCSCGHDGHGHGSHACCQGEHSCCQGEHSCGLDGCHEHGGEGECGCTEEATPGPSAVKSSRYIVKGMSCNHCRANVEKVVRGLSGVTDVSVDLHSGQMIVTGEDIDDEAVRKAVESIGFSLDL